MCNCYFEGIPQSTFGVERTKVNFYQVFLNPIIMWSIQQHLDGLRMSSERQVLTLKF